MSPARERKLLQLILDRHSKPPAVRSLKNTVIGTAVWAIAAFAVLTVVGGGSHVTWQVIAIAVIGFVAGCFTLYDMRRQASAEQWPVFSRYLDIQAVEARLLELRT